jgi:hypothetical protein
MEDPSKGLPAASQPQAQPPTIAITLKPDFQWSKFASSWWQRLLFINTDPLVSSYLKSGTGCHDAHKVNCAHCRSTMPTDGDGWSNRWGKTLQRLEQQDRHTLLNGASCDPQDLFTEDAVKTEGLISTFESGYKEAMAKSRLTSDEEQVALWRIVS